MIAWLNADEPFPPVDAALGAASAAPGLLAASETISAEQLLDAYHHGIFPWYSTGQPVLWWSPDPRMILRPTSLHISCSMRKTLRRVLRDHHWHIRVDHDFEAVMRCCAHSPRAGQDGTWITEPIVASYCDLHAGGWAHSVEIWHHDRRVGGLYGIALGRVFFGESMFAGVTDASKIALAALCAFLCDHDVQMIDCQQQTSHLASLGGEAVPRAHFMSCLDAGVRRPGIADWQFDKSVLRRWTGVPLEAE